MKIGIIGDVHLGASLAMGKKDAESGINTRLADYDSTLNSTIYDLYDKGCETLVFTGDIFEHRTPTMKQQELFSAALRRAIEKGFKAIYIVVGNHDQQRNVQATTLSYIKELPLPNIHVIDEMDMVVLDDELGNPAANLIFMPYRDKRWLDVDTNQEAIGYLDQQLAMHVSSIENDAPKILVGHMTIEGTMWMLDSYADLYNGNDIILPVDLFNSIDITVMGHVHTPAIVSKKPLIAYVGSMEKRSSSEDHDKKYVIIDIDSKSMLEFSEPCREIYDIPLALNNDPHGELLMDLIFHEVDKFASSHILKDSIVRINLYIDANDDKFCHVNKIEEYILNIHEAFHCVEIKPSLLFSRQSRDEDINEHSPDVESFHRYIDNEFMANAMKDQILENGLRIINGE